MTSKRKLEIKNIKQSPLSTNKDIYDSSDDSDEELDREIAFAVRSEVIDGCYSIAIFYTQKSNMHDVEHMVYERFGHKGVKLSKKICTLAKRRCVVFTLDNYHKDQIVFELAANDKDNSDPMWHLSTSAEKCTELSHKLESALRSHTEKL